MTSSLFSMVIASEKQKNKNKSVVEEQNLLKFINNTTIRGMVFINMLASFQSKTNVFCDASGNCFAFHDTIKTDSVAISCIFHFWVKYVTQSKKMNVGLHKACNKSNKCLHCEWLNATFPQNARDKRKKARKSGQEMLLTYSNWGIKVFGFSFTSFV